MFHDDCYSSLEEAVDASLPPLPEELPQHWQGQPKLTGAAERLRLAHCFLDHWIDLATEHYSELTAMQLIVRMNDAVCNAFGHNYDPLKEGCFTQEMRAKLEAMNKTT